MKKWTLNSWTKFPAKHLPNYVDKKELDLVLGKIQKYPPLVFAGETRSLKKALSQVGKGQVAEILLRQYEKERKNVNLMEQMDFYNEITRGSLQKFFEMFEAGDTNEEVIQHYIKNGIQIPESFISKVKKQFEQYKKLKLELGFTEQEAKDFKNSDVIKNLEGKECLIIDDYKNNIEENEFYSVLNFLKQTNKYIIVNSIFPIKDDKIKAEDLFI